MGALFLGIAAAWAAPASDFSGLVPGLKEAGQAAVASCYALHRREEALWRQDPKANPDPCAGVRRKFTGPVEVPVDPRFAPVSRTSLPAGVTPESLGLEFVEVPAGTFELGCGAWQDACKDAEKPARRVDVRAFAIAKAPVSARQWQAVMGQDRSMNCQGPECPVVSVSLEDARQFIAILNGAGGRRYRLPTEAEWEYACRAGGKAERQCVNGMGTRVVEWTCSRYERYDSGADSYAACADGAGNYVARGGDLADLRETARSSERGRPVSATFRYSRLGFRLVAD